MNISKLLFYNSWYLKWFLCSFTCRSLFFQQFCISFSCLSLFSEFGLFDSHTFPCWFFKGLSRRDLQCLVFRRFLISLGFQLFCSFLFWGAFLLRQLLFEILDLGARTTAKLHWISTDVSHGLRISVLLHGYRSLNLLGASHIVFLSGQFKHSVQTIFTSGLRNPRII